jgi:hypothetical protein
MITGKGLYNPLGETIVIANASDGISPYDLVLSANAHRRHLTAEQKRELIAKVLKAKPELSDRAIGKVAKVDHKTVASVRSKANGEFPHKARTEATGRKSRGRKPGPASVREPQPKPTQPIDTTIDPAPADTTLETAAKCWRYATAEGRQHFIAVVGPEGLWKAMSRVQRDIVLDLNDAEVEAWENGRAQVS